MSGSDEKGNVFCLRRFGNYEYFSIGFYSVDDLLLSMHLHCVSQNILIKSVDILPLDGFIGSVLYCGWNTCTLGDYGDGII
eukprot:jgi/Psemu1/312414/fgenesh1_kg.948_\